MTHYFCRTVYSVKRDAQRIVIFAGQYTVRSKRGDQKIVIFAGQYTVQSKRGDQRIVIFAGQHTVRSKCGDQSPSRLQQLLRCGMS